MTLVSAASRVDNIRHSLVGLKMPRALEMLDASPSPRSPGAKMARVNPLFEFRG
jgi:hypothetical protein